MCGGQSGVISITPLVEPLSCVKSSVFVNGSQVDPSIELKPVLPVWSTGVSSVIRCAGSFTSRLILVT